MRFLHAGQAGSAAWVGQAVLPAVWVGPGFQPAAAFPGGVTGFPKFLFPLAPATYAQRATAS